MYLFGKMKLNSYLCRAKKECDGLLHQRYITQTGYRTQPEFAKKETLRIIPQLFLVRQYGKVQLTYPIFALLVTLFKKKNDGKRHNCKFVIFMIVFYNVMLLLSLYSPKLKKTIKYTYWTVHGLIVLCLLFNFLMIGVAAKADAELDRPFVGTKEMIIK